MRGSATLKLTKGLTKVKEVVCAIFYTYPTSGACADMCACDCMYEMEKTEHRIWGKPF